MVRGLDMSRRSNKSRLIQYMYETLEDRGPLKVWEIQGIAFTTMTKGTNATLPVRAIRVSKNEMSNVLRRCSLFAYDTGTEEWSTLPISQVAKSMAGKKHLQKSMNGLPTILREEIERLNS